MPEHYFSEKPSSTDVRGLIKTRLRGIDFEFETSSGIFSHKRVDLGTRLLIESMRIPTEGKVLDLGCGYGVIGIVLAKLNPMLDVWLTDINTRATVLAMINLRRNGVRAIVKHGPLYNPVNDIKFNLIIMNPPISAGINSTVKPMILGATGHLVKGGALQLVIQSNKGGRILSAIIEDAFGNLEVTAKSGGFRVFTALNTLAW
jgi:16S rRNA (guanine1207-N2)-methyltransferase